MQSIEAIVARTEKAAGRDTVREREWIPVKKDWLKGWSIDLLPIEPRTPKTKLNEWSGFDLWHPHGFRFGRVYTILVKDIPPKNGFSPPGFFLFDFDSQGRMVNASYTKDNWKGQPFNTYRPEIHKLLSGTWIQGRWENRPPFDTGLNYQPVIVKQGDLVYDIIMETLDGLVDVLRRASIPESEKSSDAPRLIKTLSELAIKNHEGLLKESERLHSIIESQIPVLPPHLAHHHYHALPVRVQKGCGGGCTFCNFYANRKIEILPREDVFNQIDRIAEYVGEEVDHFSQVVLLDGDALTVPTEQLGSELQYAREKFGFLPNETTVKPWYLPIERSTRPWNFAHAFVKAKTVLRRTADELTYLREEGLIFVNMGLETACKELLRVVKPGQKVEDFKGAVERLVSVGIVPTVNVIVGLGGKKFGQQHLKETASFLRSLPPQTIVYFAYLDLKADSSYAKKQQDLFIPLERDELIRQKKAFKNALPYAYEYVFIPM